MSTIDRTITPVQRFWQLLKPDRKEIRNVYAYAVFNGLLSLSLPLGIQAIVSLIQGGQLSTSWIMLTIFVVLGVGLVGVLQIYQLRITENLQQKIFARAAFEFAYRIPKIRLEALYQHYAPELMNRFFDIVSVQKGLSKLLIDFSAATLQVIFGLLLLSTYHPFFILFSIGLILMVYGIFRLTGRRGLSTSLIESKNKYKVAHWLEEVARTATTFKLAGKTSLHLHRVDEHVVDYLEAREGHFKVLLRQYQLMVLFKVLVIAGLLAIGGILVMEQHMNIGQFIAAEIIILLIMGSVEKLVLSLETIYDVFTSLEKVGQVTDLELENEKGIDLKAASQDEGLRVTLDGVSFSYPDNHEKTLDNLSITMEPGEKLFILGPNGSGKSTLLHVLAGLFEVQEGALAYNGFAKGNLELRSLRSAIGDCLSQEQLFAGTVLENIAMGREDATFENVQKVVRNLGLEGFIQKLPKGYETILDPQGKKLPRSTVQKLLLARSIADQPKLLLLEDAFEHLDASERKTTINYLTAPENPWTLVAVSSDPYLASRCSQIALMEKGKIVKTDTYKAMQSLVESTFNRHA